MSEEPVSKVDFDQMTGFKFQAAYKAYSELFDELSDEEKQALNDNIYRLYNNDINYTQFYDKVNEYRGNAVRGRWFHRKRIRGQRKRAYRRDQQEKNRIKRHKK